LTACQVIGQAIINTPVRN